MIVSTRVRAEAPNRIEWALYATGQPVRLTRGIHYRTTTAAAAQAGRTWASSHGMTATIQQAGDHLTVLFIRPDVDAQTIQRVDCDHEWTFDRRQLKTGIVWAVYSCGLCQRATLSEALYSTAPLPRVHPVSESVR